MGATKQLNTDTPLELARKVTLFWQAQKREEANLKRRRGRGRRSGACGWQRREEAKDYFHVPNVGVFSCIPAAIWLESRLHNLSLPDVLTIFWVQIVVIALTFILRTLHTQELVADGLEQRLDSLEQRLEQEVKTGGSGWLVVTDRMEQCLNILEQRLEEEVEAGGSPMHRRP